MIDVTWLENLALNIDFELENQILKQQAPEIQKAYENNDQHALASFLNNNNQKNAHKNVIFTL